MKLVLVLFFTISLSGTIIAQAQDLTPEQKNDFLMRRFPEHMPADVMKNTIIMPVDSAFAEDHTKKYQYLDGDGVVYEGKVRIGDTLAIFGDEPFYSVGQHLLMANVTKQKKVKAPRAPKNPEQTARTVSLVVNTVGTVVNVVRSLGGLPQQSQQTGYTGTGMDLTP